MKTEKIMNRKEKRENEKRQIDFLNALSDELQKDDCKRNYEALRLLEPYIRDNTEFQNLMYLQLLACMLKEINSSLMETAVSSDNQLGKNSEIHQLNSDDSLTKIIKEKIYPAQVFKSFKELCNYIGINYPNGRTQIQCVKTKLARFFDFYEIENSHKIFIIEIYDEPLEEKKYTGKYLTDLKLLLIDFLIDYANKNIPCDASSDYMEIKTTYTRLAVNQLKLVTPFFYDEVNGKLWINEFFYNNFENEFTDKFFKVESNIKYNLTILHYRLFEKVKNEIHSALNGLKKDGLIDFKACHIAKISDSRWNELNSEEESYFEKVKKEVATSLGYKNSYDCLYNGKYPEFEAKLNEIIFEEKGWLETRNRVTIYYNLMRLKMFQFGCRNIEHHRNTLLNSLAKTLLERAVKDYEKDSKKLQEEFASYYNILSEITCETREEIFDEYEYSKCRKYKRESFVERQELLISYLVNPNEEKHNQLLKYRDNCVNTLQSNL